MIGLFDSGHGGLTVRRSLIERFPAISFIYLGDHASAPYGNRPSEEVVDLTRTGVEWLFRSGCRLVLLACNTATAVAARTLQRDWLPGSGYKGRNILGIVAPTVEAATQTPWAVTSPQYPQKYNSETIAVLGTARTIASGVYREEIAKRCPKVRVVQQACPRLVGAIEQGRPEAELDQLVAGYVADLLAATEGEAPDRAILGCTHFPLIEALFRHHLPRATRLLSQPGIVADSLEDYLARHPEYLDQGVGRRGSLVLTTGNAGKATATLRKFWPEPLEFEQVSLARPLKRS
jgi:glutamate racemase